MDIYRVNHKRTINSARERKWSNIWKTKEHCKNEIGAQRRKTKLANLLYPKTYQ